MSPLYPLVATGDNGGGRDLADGAATGRVEAAFPVGESRCGEDRFSTRARGPVLAGRRAGSGAVWAGGRGRLGRLSPVASLRRPWGRLPCRRACLTLGEGLGVAPGACQEARGGSVVARRTAVEAGGQVVGVDAERPLDALEDRARYCPLSAECRRWRSRPQIGGGKTVRRVFENVHNVHFGIRPVSGRPATGSETIARGKRSTAPGDELSVRHRPCGSRPRLARGQSRGRAVRSSVSDG